MTHDEAVQLAVKITEAWPARGLKPEVWADELEHLDHATACTAFVRLKRTLDKPPTIADLHRVIPACAPRHEPNGPEPYGHSPYQRPGRPEAVISFGEHIALLEIDAKRGRPGALDELRRWHHATIQAGAFRLGPKMAAVLCDVLEGTTLDLGPGLLTAPEAR